MGVAVWVFMSTLLKRIVVNASSSVMRGVLEPPTRHLVSLRCAQKHDTYSDKPDDGSKPKHRFQFGKTW